MAALARWCVQHRLVAVLLWLAAFGGVSAAAVVTGSAYSNDYEVPGTESGRATQLLKDGFPGFGGDSDTVVWHTSPGTVRSADVEQSMTRTLDKIEKLPGVASVDSPYQGQCAVSAMITHPLVRASAFSWRVVSQPSSPGMPRSIRIRRGRCLRASSIASAPVEAWITVNPRNARYSATISRPSGKSSTTRTEGTWDMG